MAPNRNGHIGIPVFVENATDTDISELSSEEFAQSYVTEALPELPSMDDSDDSVSKDVEPNIIESASDLGIEYYTYIMSIMIERLNCS